MMKRIALRNVSTQRQVFPEFRNGLVFEPGETKMVLPAVVQHPAIKTKLGKTLLKDPTASIPASPPTESKSPPTEPVAREESESVTEPIPQESQEEPEVVEESIAEEPEAQEEEESGKEPEVETAGESLREAFLEAPGITEKNVNAILDAFPSKEVLTSADEEDLTSLGVSKSYAKKVLAWAAK